jgi:CO/xanthine dehydrogenase Mo-binding subunit
MPLRIAEVPELDISFVESGEVPVGLGEPATTVAGPAIGKQSLQQSAAGCGIFQLPPTRSGPPFRLSAGV